MITRVCIESFKSLLDVEVELGQVNVVIGANGSGKSNFLESLGVLGAAASGRVDDESLRRRGVRLGVPALYKSSFSQVRPKPEIRLTAQWAGSRASYAAGLWNPIHDPAPSWRYHSETCADDTGERVGRSPATTEAPNKEAGLAALHLVKVPPERPMAVLLRLLQGYVIYAPTTEVLRSVVPDQQQQAPVGLSGGRLPEAVRELLLLRHSDVGEHGDYYDQLARQAGELVDWASNISVGPPSPEILSPSVPSERSILRFRDRYMADGRNTLTAYDASEGALYVLLAAVLSAHPRIPGFFAVDNFDHSLNPRLAQRLIRRMCEWILAAPAPRQVVLTTHSPLVLDGLDLTDDRVRLFTADRTSKGRTVIRRVVVDADMLRKAEEGWTLSRLWVMGMIGGVPGV